MKVKVARKRRKHTLHERLDHLFFLSWRRNEKLNRKLDKIMALEDDLKREMEEMGTAVNEMLVEQKRLIDIIAASPNLSAAVTAAVAELDALQSRIKAAIPTPPTPTPDPVP